MRYTDVFEKAWDIPPQAMEPFRLSKRSLSALVRGGLSPERFERLLPTRARGQSGQILILTDGEASFAVPAPVLEPFPSTANPGFGKVEALPPEILEEPIIEIEECIETEEPVLEGMDPFELSDERFDYETYYAHELAHPGVRKLHEYFNERNTYEVFFKSHDPRRQRSRSFTYGDTAVPAIFRILCRVGASRDDIFVDLGCGCGGAVLTAALLVKEARGIDLVPGVVDFCRKAAEDLGIANASFIVDDIRNAEIRDATIVYCAATTFPSRLVRAVNSQVRTTRPGTRVISITQPLGSRGLITARQEYVMFSWSGDRYAINHTVYFQERIP
jgi:hypothetical protein